MSVMGLSKSSKRTRKVVSIIAVLALLAALLPVVPAWAAETLTISPDKSSAGATVEYTVTASGLSLTVADVTYNDPCAMEVSFPSGSTLQTNTAVPVVVTVGTTDYYAQVIPIINGTSYQLTVPAAALPSSGTVTAVRISGLKVTNPNITSGEVKLTFKKPEPDKELKATLTLVKGVASIKVDKPTAGEEFGIGKSILVSGYVKDVGDQPVGGANVTINGESAGLTLSTGYFEKTITAPSRAMDSWKITIVASKTIDGVETSTTQEVTVKIVSEPTKLNFASPPSALTKGVRAKLTVQLLDANNEPAKPKNSPVNVVLSAVDASNNLAGRFYDELTGGKEITSITIGTTSTSAAVYLEPIVTGTITVRAQASGLTAASFQANVAAAPSKATLTLTPTLIQDGSPVAGWPIKAVVTLDQPAGQDEPVTIAVSGVTDYKIKSSPELKYYTDLTSISNDTITVGAGKTEATFYILTNGNTAVGSAVTVNVTVAGLSDSKTTANLVKYVQPPLERILNAGWNVLSTPLELAGDGNLASLVGGADRFEVAYTYDPSTPEKWVQVTSQKLEVMKGYFVKMKQAGTALYTFKKATSPTQAMPKTAELKAGWNLLGVSVQPGDTKTVADILANVKDKYSAVVNPGKSLGNKADWKAVTPTSASDAGSRVYAGDAYWVYMTEDGVVAGLAVPEIAQ